MSRIKKSFHWVIVGFAVADVAMGIISLFLNDLIAQVVALIVTGITLYLTVIYSRLYCKDKKIDIGGILIGAADFFVTALSIMVIAFSIQILELIASGMTLFKTIKIVIQSDKAKRLIKVAEPLAKTALVKVATTVIKFIITKTKKLKLNKGVFSMEKVKEYFVKLGNLIRANKVSLLTTIANGGVWGVAGFLVDGVEQVAIEIGGFNITPFISIVGFILVELGFQWESFGTFISRISPKLEAKLAKRKEKEEKKAQKEAEAEKEKLIAQMKAEKEAARKAQEEKELEEWLAEKQKNIQE